MALTALTTGVGVGVGVDAGAAGLEELPDPPQATTRTMNSALEAAVQRERTGILSYPLTVSRPLAT
jgi:hypothetical protein